MNDVNGDTQTMTVSQTAGRRGQEQATGTRNAGIYRPSPQQLPIHHSHAKEILHAEKRSGKSYGDAIEFASRILGIPIVAQMALKFSEVASRPTSTFVLGHRLGHSILIFKFLFEKGMGGQFRTIQDEATGKWRTYDRTNPKDHARYRESKLTEPSILERFIDMQSWSWEEKKANQFKSVRLKNGAWIHCYPSSARNPKQGEAVSGIWVDEDIQYGLHLKEWQDRLTDEEGWFLWSVWPHIKNDALMNLLDRAEASLEEQDPQIQAFQLIMTDNPYLTDKAKRESLNMMETEEEIGRRNRGELQLDLISMYDFQPQTHLIKRLDEKQTNEPRLMTLLRKIWSNTTVPGLDWYRCGSSCKPESCRGSCHCRNGNNRNIAIWSGS